jgi:nitrogen-specific signal transduction histidine kinase
MNLKPAVLVCSANEEVLRRIAAAVLDEARIVRVADRCEAAERLALYDPFALIVDVCLDDLYDHLDEWIASHPDLPIIVIGHPRSDRVLFLERLDVFAFADPEDDYREWQQIIRLAKKHHRAKSDLRLLKEQIPPPPPATAPASAPPAAAREAPSIIHHVAGAFRHFEHVDMMLDRAVEGLATAAHTTRAGLFTRDEATGLYRLRVGLRYLRDTAEAVYEPRDPLVRWFERHAHMITRTMAGQLPDPAQRQLLMRSLEIAGADVMVPLHARGRLLGWFFIGCRSTGLAYSLNELEELSLAADYLAMLLENALLYREVTVQKKLAETLLHSLPTGIIAVDGGGLIRWFSTAAEAMLERTSDTIVGEKIEALGARLADIVHRAMSGEAAPPTRAWEEPGTRRYLQAEARHLGGPAEKLGAVVIIQDLTSIRHLQEKQAQLERTAFWNDLAAGLSHEIRNPLVAIRTFAQLLPERYQDDEFRDEFSALVTQEVDRLNAIIEQINGFAQTPDLVQAPVDVRTSLQAALHRTFSSASKTNVTIKAHCDGNLPLVRGDEKALATAFAHLFQNAAEALEGRTNGLIDYTARTVNGAGREKSVQITIHDNGKGIPDDVKDKVFSPFYTTKARGMGLGLPIVRRTVIDHNGRVDIGSSSKGTDVVIELPAVPDEDREGAP